MKAIVVDDYPAGKLPEDLRRDIDPQTRVRVVVQADDSPSHGDMLSTIGSAPGLYTSPEDAVAYIRKLRDEW